MTIALNIKQKIIIYLFLSVYAFALIRPISPVVNDFVAHTFFKMQHMATVHYENGTFHVHKELRKAAEKTGNTSTSNLVFENLAVHLHNPFLCTVSTPQQNDLETYFAYINFPVDIYLKSPTPPPKA